MSAMSADATAAAARSLASLRPVTSSPSSRQSTASINADALVVGVAPGRRRPASSPRSRGRSTRRWRPAAGVAHRASGANGRRRTRSSSPDARPGRGAAGRRHRARRRRDAVRRGAGRARSAPRSRRWPASARVVTSPIDGAADAGAVAEGALLGAYAFTAATTVSTADHPPALRTVAIAGPATAERAARPRSRGPGRRRGRRRSPATWSTPRPTTCTRRPSPSAVAERAEAAGLEVEVLDERALKRRRLRRHPRRRRRARRTRRGWSGSRYRPARARTRTWRSSARASPSTRAA